MMRTLVIGFVLMIAASASAQIRGIDGQTAPSWKVDTWYNLPEGKKTLDVSDFEGKVIYLYCFQSWCPGCHSHGFPTLQALIEHYKENDDVAFVTVQTTFEGFGTNTSKAAKRTAADKGLTIPVGHSGTGGQRSALMRDYRTGGTPWTIVIDRQGNVRYNAFRITERRAVRLIDKLLTEPARVASGDIETLPLVRGGQDVVGEAWEGLRPDAWLNCEEDLRKRLGTADQGHVTLYRWWTDGCAFCEASLPAIEQLRKKYEDRGLDVVCVYHPKPVREVDEKTILATAKRLGYNGAIATDMDWSELERLYLGRAERPATSVTILTDGTGTVRFVHPGPMFFPADQREDATPNEDFELLENAIVTLLPTE